MPESVLNILAVSGSPRLRSVTRTVIRLMAQELSSRGCAADLLDLRETVLPLYNPDTAYAAPGFAELQARIDRADVMLLGTPDYHGSISSTLKNFLDHFWHEFCGKLLVPIVASHEKGLTVIDQLRTVARQCYAWTLPYGLSFSEQDVRDGQVINESVRKRMEMMLRDTEVYGRLLAQQRRADLAGTDPGFMARHRKKAS
ncbi:MAG TPA: NAD(P)H-dependent oxidoreductase [Verrucomicrobia bacterium]|nr:NAD(P)H-dependent oxidoreductase [Verrucomicrobiota bacterium]HOB32078.1 NAD(P)H-dependent oxidoreductase [Verrucomicrobiota bacterium]HOP96658.1 NAD(P)H-dependent oxidoreductase [Verrucomicrobiota bacterium]